MTEVSPKNLPLHHILQAAADIIAGILDGQSLMKVLPRRLAALPAPARAAVQDAVYGSLRHYGRLQAMLATRLSRAPAERRVAALLLVALYELEHSRHSPYAIVNEAVIAVRRMGQSRLAGLCNAVLRTLLREKEAVLEEIRTNAVATYNLPEWWLAQLQADYPANWQQVAAQASTRPPMTLRVNLGRTTVADYRACLDAAGRASTPLGQAALVLAEPCSVSELPGFAEGLVSVQDASAQHAARLLDVADGMRVLDACAAPGGKTLHLLEAARLDLVALDVEPERLAKVAENLARGGKSAHLLAGDATRTADWWDGRPFDRILLDAPCSASGITRRQPDVKWRRTAADIQQLVQTQAEIFQALWHCLRSGGKLLYVTCSVFREENQRQAERFLMACPDARLLPLQGEDTPGWQILPDEQQDGFFYALFQKA